MPRFHPLEVVELRHDTRDSVVVTLRPCTPDTPFKFRHGQYLTFRRDFDGTELRRSYSICSGLDDGTLRVGVKRVDGGAFSTWVKEDLKLHDRIDAMPPLGKFTTELQPEAARTYAGFAVGSGITPVLSIIRTILAREPLSNFTLVYANRQIGSIMFREELEDLKNTYLGRLSVIHILKTEGQDIDLFSGRIDRQKLDALFANWIRPSDIDMAFICGPEPLKALISDALKAHGLADEQIRYELFAAAQPGRAAARAVSKQAAMAGHECKLSVTLDGATREMTMPMDGTTVLETALKNDIDAPFSCKAGVCSTCRAKVLEGEVEMKLNHALEDDELRAGYVLSCQCIPLTERLVLTYDA